METNRARARGQATVGALTVPFMVGDHAPVDFATTDPRRVAECAKHHKCGICGGKIRGTVIAFVGPDDGRACFADPWMHESCARQAMAECPFLSARRSWREVEARAMPEIAMYAHNMVIYLAHGGSSHQDAFGRWHFEASGPAEVLRA